MIAKTDISTQDGTLRYREGQIVDEITCDENGYGESKELYLGEYTVRQKEIPQYYAGQTEELDCMVEKKSEVEVPLNTLESERSRIILTLADELYSSRSIEGATFQITNRNGKTTTATTDASVRIVLEELDKNTTYTIRQTGTAEDYAIDPMEYPFHVTADGRIDGDVQKELALTNRVIRVSIGAASNILGGQRAGVELSLYDASDNLLRTWTTTNVPITFTDLKEGSYYVTMGENSDKHYTFQVADQAAVQTVNVGASKTARYLLIGGSMVVLLGIVAAGIAALRKRKKKERS